MSLKAELFGQVSAVAAAEPGYSAVVSPGARGFSGLRNRSDSWLIGGSVIYLAVILLHPRVWTIGLGIWWVLNTVAHNFIHQPFFRSRTGNRWFAFYLTILTGIPQRLWRERHLAHHAERPWRPRFSRELMLQLGVVSAFWTAVWFAWPQGMVRVAAPGFLLGMGLCWMQGHFEHGPGATSNYGLIYNWLFFNDGFHREHHRRPGAHWTALPRQRAEGRFSKWPAILRWLEWFDLNGLERIVARSPRLQKWMVRSHTVALRNLAREIPEPRRVAIIGGGLFPRTALVVRAIWPRAKVTIIESDAAHLQFCRRWLRGDEELVHARVRAEALPEADLIFVPLAFDQEKRELYRCSRAQSIIIHDWLWKRSERTAITSVFLFKRMNLLVA